MPSVCSSAKSKTLRQKVVMGRWFADIIAGGGDSLQDISEMQQVKFVMKGGTVIKNDMAMALGTMTSSN